MLLTLKAACEAICARALASLAGLLPGAAASTLQTIAIGLLAIDALELAVMFRQPIEALTGRSLLPVLTGTAQQTHPADEAIGHELSGNQALFKGDLKPVLNLPPVGDGQWPRHNLRTDPGETQDLRQRMPEVFQLMRSDYEAVGQGPRRAAGPCRHQPGATGDDQQLLHLLAADRPVPRAGAALGPARPGGHRRADAPATSIPMTASGHLHRPWPAEDRLLAVRPCARLTWSNEPCEHGTL